MGRTADIVSGKWCHFIPSFPFHCFIPRYRCFIGVSVSLPGSYAGVSVAGHRGPSRHKAHKLRHLTPVSKLQLLQQLWLERVLLGALEEVPP